MKTRHLPAYIPLLTMFVISSYSMAGQSRSAPDSQPRSSSELQEKLLNATIENQRAQAAYYTALSKKDENVSNLMSGVPAILGAVLGAASTFAGVLLTLGHQRRLEKEKHTQAVHLDHEKEVRLALASYLGKLATVTQVFVDELWLASHTPAELTRETIESYANKTRQYTAELAQAFVVLVSLEEGFFDTAQELSRKLHQLDDVTSAAITEWEKLINVPDEPEAKAFAETHLRTVFAFMDDLPEKVKGMSKMVRGANTSKTVEARRWTW